MWKKKLWIFHKENTPTHTAVIVRSILLSLPLYSKVLVYFFMFLKVKEALKNVFRIHQCWLLATFFIFSKVKEALEGTRFATVKAFKEKTTETTDILLGNRLEIFVLMSGKFEWKTIGIGVRSILKVIR